MDLQYKPTKQKKEKPVKAPKAPKAEKAMKLGNVAAVKPAKAPKTPKAEKAPKMAKTMKLESQKPMQFGKVQDSAKSSSGALRKPVKPSVVVAVFAVVAVIVVGVVIASFFGTGDDSTVIQSISIANPPEKTSYYVGESANYYGLKVLLTMSDGTSFTINAQDCQISGFDSSNPTDNQTITVAYRDMSATFTVTIEEMPVINESRDLIAVSIKTYPKTEYKVGDWMSVEGGVLLAEYDDGSTSEVAMTYDHVSGFSTKEPGVYTLTVQYVEKGLIATCTFTITVTG